LTRVLVTLSVVTRDLVKHEQAGGAMIPKKSLPAPRGEPDVHDQRDISDPRTMRALAHPVRLALLEALRREGPLTATRAAELLDDSPGNMSWHLQTLAKYGFVEEAGGGRGRSRPWRVVALTVSVKGRPSSDPEFASAEDALEASVQERSYQALREWRSGRLSFPPVWHTSAFSTHSLAYLTAEELKGLSAEIVALLTRYNSRLLDKSERPPDALPVHIFAVGHPLPPTPSGN
jgi:DNA-binding transcriptional ArsR family regulator